MRYVNLGGCGLKVSQIGLGMMSYGDPASQQWALNSGSAVSARPGPGPATAPTGPPTST